MTAMNKKALFAEIPLHPDNWLPDPNTQTEVEEWMKQTKDLLKKWLGATHRDFHREDKVVKAFKALNAESEREWKKHEPRTDVQTGTISNRDHKNMRIDMARIKEEKNRFHEIHHTRYRHVVRRYAAMAWEDFLYYQNVWNRRYLDPSKEFKLITQNVGQKEMKEQQKPPETRSSKSKPSASTTSGFEIANGSLYRPTVFGDLDGAPEFELDYLFRQWNAHVIPLYMRFRLAYRKHIPDVVDPEHAHRYSQPPRATTAPGHQDRREHLEISFPRRKRKRPAASDVVGAGIENEKHDSSEVEEFPSSSRNEEDRRRESRGEMEDIIWQMDEDAVKAYARKKVKKPAENDAEYVQATKTRLSEAHHKTYHGSKASSFNWPTSFDSKDWGNNIAFTNNEKLYLYEKDSDVKYLSDAEKARRTDATGRVRMIEKKPRYNMVPDNTIKTIHWKVGKTLHSATKVVETIKFEPEGRSRVALPPRFMFKRRYRVHLQTVSALGVTRKEKHEAADRMEELSESEDENHLPTNQYYRRSGNENPGNIGKGPGYDDYNDDQDDDGDGSSGSDAGNGITGGAHRRPGEENDESDDEGDLFKQSYEECSKPAESRLMTPDSDN